MSHNICKLVYYQQKCVNKLTTSLIFFSNTFDNNTIHYYQNNWDAINSLGCIYAPSLPKSHVYSYYYFEEKSRLLLWEKLGLLL